MKRNRGLAPVPYLCIGRGNRSRISVFNSYARSQPEHDCAEVRLVSRGSIPFSRTDVLFRGSADCLRFLATGRPTNVAHPGVALGRAAGVVDPHGFHFGLPCPPGLEGRLSLVGTC